MSFRRPHDAANERQRWRRFVRQHFDELCEIGMPEHIFRDKTAFDHWLMHGYHPSDPSRFTIEPHDQTKQNVFIQLIRAYADAGFSDPGISVITWEEKQRIFSKNR